MTRRPGVFSFLQNDTSTYAKACHVRPTRPTCPTRPTKTLSTELCPMKRETRFAFLCVQRD